MAPNLSLLVFLFVLLPAAGNAAATVAAPAPSPSGNAAFNVTEILAPYPELKLFNMLLSKMLLAGEINSRSSITILATNNLCVEWLLRRTARLPRTSVADIVSFHVVLDYIDAARLAALPRGAQPIVFTTLYQTTGRARNRTGFVNITAEPRDVVFAPATPGSRGACVMPTPQEVVRLSRVRSVSTLNCVHATHRTISACSCIGERSMAPNLSLLVFLFLLLPVAGNAAATAPPTPSPSGNGSAFNVTAILARYPEFKLFNLLLSKTQVAREINSRNSITVLATNNAAVDWLLRRSSKLSRTSLAELMSVHVILDYIDAAKLAALPRGGQPAVATTLFQTTGTARNRTGFLNITAAPRGGGAVFVSAAPGSLVSATFKRVVTAKPYNISVLQISNFIVPPHIVTRPLPPSPPAPRMRQMAIAPSPAPTVAQFPTTQPSSQGDTSEAPEAEAPAPSHGGHVGKATSWWIGVAVGMSCMLRFL
nr:unnamed protein product [Digitaria exilis]